MGKRSPSVTDSLHILLVQLLETNRPDLANRYQQVLQEDLFSSRSIMRPSMLKNIALDEIESLNNFLRYPHLPATERGVQLYKAGLGEQPVLRLGQATRQFFLTHLENGQIAPTLEAIDAYQEGVVQGYIQSLEKAVFSEQERIRHAFERVVNREK